MPETLLTASVHRSISTHGMHNTRVAAERSERDGGRIQKIGLCMLQIRQKCRFDLGTIRGPTGWARRVLALHMRHVMVT